MKTFELGNIIREGEYTPPIERAGYLYRAYHSTYQFDEYGGTYVTIQFDELEIIKTTPKGVWIAEPFDSDKKPWKWVSLSTRKAYAYPTQKEAMHSYLIRKKRHVAHLEYSIKSMRFAIGLLESKELLEKKND